MLNFKRVLRFFSVAGATFLCIGLVGGLFAILGAAFGLELDKIIESPIGNLLGATVFSGVFVTIFVTLVKMWFPEILFGDDSIRPPIFSRDTQHIIRERAGSANAEALPMDDAFSLSPATPSPRSVGIGLAVSRPCSSLCGSYRLFLCDVIWGCAGYWRCDGSPNRRFASTRCTPAWRRGSDWTTPRIGRNTVPRYAFLLECCLPTYVLSSSPFWRPESWISCNSCGCVLLRRSHACSRPTTCRTTIMH